MGVKLKSLNSKLETYEATLNYLTKWCQDNQDLSKEISNWIKTSVNELNANHLKTITNYHIEISKINYATIALLDKVYRQKERLEKWQEEIEKVQ